MNPVARASFSGGQNLWIAECAILIRDNLGNLITNGADSGSKRGGDVVTRAQNDSRLRRTQARARDDTKFLGHVCKYGHTPAWRYVSGGRCCACDARDRAAKADITRKKRMGTYQEVSSEDWRAMWARLYGAAAKRPTIDCGSTSAET